MAGVASLLAVLGLRLYAAFSYPAIRTPWDDAIFKRQARSLVREQTTVTALARVLTPRTPPLLDGRVNGYVSWLVLGQRLRMLVGSEAAGLAFQLVNVALLWFQAVVVLLFAWWSTRDLAFSASVSFLHASAPIVFGMSRWLLSENLVLAAGLALSALAAAYLAEAPAVPRSWSPPVARAVLVAYLMGLFAAAREYAAPSYLAIVTCVMLTLLLQRRLVEAASFGVVISCFTVPLGRPLLAAARVLALKGGATEYFHPLSQWIPHVILFTVGPALTVLLMGFCVVVAREAGRDIRRRGRPRPLAALGALRRREPGSGLRALYWTHWALLVFYVVGIVASRNRVTRPAIMPMLVLLALLLLYLQSRPSARASLRVPQARLAALALIACSWSVLGWQLLWAFDGGRTYAHAADRMEYFNYPLRLRPLQGQDDSYICYDPCPYDK